MASVLSPPPAGAVLEPSPVAAPAAGPALTHLLSRRWMMAIAVMSSAVMQTLDATVVNVSLPHIAGSLSSGVDEATWVLTSYLVANAIVLPITGWLAGLVGRKRMLLLTVTGFTLASLLCGLAPSLPMLIVFRVVQGLAGGGLQPLSQAALLEEFPGKEQGKAMAFWGFGLVAAPVLGPTLGGWLTDTWSWRWIFFINLPVGVLSLVLISAYVVDPHYIRRISRHIDGWGIGMLAVGMGALQVMLDKGQEKDWFASGLIRALCVSTIVFLTAFVVRELLVPDPIVHFRLLRNRTFAAGILQTVVMGFVLYGSLVLLPLFMQTLLGWTATTAGLWNSPRGIGIALSMPVVGFLLGRGWDGRRMLVFGFVTGGLTFFAYEQMTLASGTWDIFWPQLIQGFGMGFVFVPLTTLTMSTVPKSETGYATSLYSTMRNIGSSVGISFVTTLVARRSQFHQQALGEHLTAGNSMAQQRMPAMAQYLARQGFDPVTAVHKAGGLIYIELQRQAALLSYGDAFHLMGLLFLTSIPIVFLMRRVEHNRRRVSLDEP